MRLRCTSRYASSFGTYLPDEIIDVNDETGALLLRDSAASFVVVPDAGPSTEASGVTVATTETASGLEVPDRMARGGKRRGTKSSEA